MVVESMVLHITLVLSLLCFITSCGYRPHPFLFFLSLLYLYMVNERYILKLRKRLQFEERKNAYQRRLLSDSESVRWLNRALEKIWPICAEKIASQQFLMAIIPWFLDKYKPWTAKKAIVQQLYLGRNPPLLTGIRVLSESTDDDHLVLELGMNFLSAEDLSAILAVQLRKRLGFGMWAKMHITGMHVEGKVLVGVKFLRQWPFLGRIRLCFVEPPYFNMTVKPIFSHGVNVTEIPGIAGWLEKLLDVAFEQTLVQPNMLVVDVEKFVSAPTESWFTIDEKPPAAIAKVEIIEAADMKPSDPNGLADPYVKGQLGPYRFRTKTQKRTLTPKWLEEFRIPISSWEAQNTLVLEVCDKDTLFDDNMGDCSINITELKGGERHDKWLSLKNIKMGRVHVAITIMDPDAAQREHFSGNEELFTKSENVTPKSVTDTSLKSPSYTDADTGSIEEQKIVDQYEPIDIEGQEKTGVWVHRPGSDVSQTWEPRKGRQRHSESQIYRVAKNESTVSPSSVTCESNRSDSSSNNEEVDGGNSTKQGGIMKGMHKIGSLFLRSPRKIVLPQSPPKGSSSTEVNQVATPEPQIIQASKGPKVKIVLDCDTEEGARAEKSGAASEKSGAAFGQ